MQNSNVTFSLLWFSPSVSLALPGNTKLQRGRSKVTKHKSAAFEVFTNGDVPYLLQVWQKSKSL